MRCNSLILITVDCLRADHVGYMGYRLPTTPFLDCLSEQSIIFRNATAAGSPTYFAMPAVLASRYPLALGRDLIGLAPHESTIASELQDSGFKTAAFCAANPYLSSQFGYDRGFEVFADFLDSAAAPPMRQELSWRTRTNRAMATAVHSVGFLGAAYDELYFQYCQKFGVSKDVSFDAMRRFPSADVIVDRALAWLKDNCSGRFFLWLHLMDPHSPYFPTPEALDLIGAPDISPTEAVYLNSFWNRGDLTPKRLRAKKDRVTSLYDAGIRWADEQIRRLVEGLVDLNVWNNCGLAVTADHGEEFLEHGGRYHLPRKMTQELLHVPLMLRVPDSGVKRDIATPFSILDLAPTLLDILDVPPPADFRGRSCWSAVRKNVWRTRPVLSECVHDCTNPFRSENRIGPRLLAVREDRFKLTVDFSTAKDELYDLSNDPGENHPLEGGETEQVRRRLLQYARNHVAESSQSRDFDRRLGSQLRELRLEWAHSAAHISTN